MINGSVDVPNDRVEKFRNEFTSEGITPEETGRWIFTFEVKGGIFGTK